MARVTVEDCFQNINNRFELVLIAVQRARDIYSGASITLNRDNDKDVVIALREIAANTISIDKVKERIFYRSQNLKNNTHYDEKKNSSDVSITQINKTKNENILENEINKSSLNKTNNTQKIDNEEIENYTDIDIENIFPNKNSDKKEP